jgi:GNAT superfamily N-acetyltransferase
MPNRLDPITIRPFQPADQVEAKALILAGLVEHWGFLDPTLNPDLDDITSHYAEATFVVARQGGRLVGTGALVPRCAEQAEIMRMSVAKELRRQGIGRLLLQRLCVVAQGQGFQRVILETTDTWHDVIQFYQQFGFQITHYHAGDIYFALDLAEQ